MTQGLDVLFGWLGLAALVGVLALVMYRQSRRR